MYAVYGRRVGEPERAERPVDLRDNSFCHQSIYITMFGGRELPEIEPIVKEMNKLNKHYTFRIRKA